MREIRYELLRPDQLLKERERCPLIFVPVGPLEYHGPHLPLGTDPINAEQCALGACERLGKGVGLPTTYIGTERERPAWMNESLGFDKDDWTLGMDFPTALWKSHYHQEQIFGLAMADLIEMLIAHSYKVIVIVNGHGAKNQLDTIDRLAKHYSHASDVLVVWRLAFPLNLLEENVAGHADIYETSVMLHYQERFYAGVKLVDLTRLPPRNVPIRYKDFSVVDGPGFTEHPHPDRVVQADPRDSEAEQGKKIFEDTVSMFVELAKDALKKKGLPYG